MPSERPPAVAQRAAVLRRLELDVARRLDGMVSGDFLAARPGPGSEPSGARAYQPGDDARRMDWSLTARSLTPHVRTTQADRELETWIVADRSASLDFGTARHEKREVVLAVAAAFGALTMRGGNRLGLVIAGGERPLTLRARSGRAAGLAALATLYDTPRRTSAPGPGAELASCLHGLVRTQPRRGLIVVASDFLDASSRDASGWAAGLGRLARRHQVIAAQILDPRELELPSVGLLSLVDTETGRVLDVQTGSAALRARYASAAAERQATLRRTILGAGAEHLVLSTDRDWLADIVAYLGRRRPERMPRGVLATMVAPPPAGALPAFGVAGGWERPSGATSAT